MNFIWLDASALIKRYAAEVGTPLVNYIFSEVDPSHLLSMLEGVGEVFSALVRKRNTGTLANILFHQVIINLRAEIVNDPSVEKVHPTHQQVSNPWDFIEKHSLNSTDAVILRCALDKAVELRAAEHDLVLVSADARFLRTAQAGGLLTFNPETDSQAALDALITPRPAPSPAP